MRTMIMIATASLSLAAGCATHPTTRSAATTKPSPTTLRVSGDRQTIPLDAGWRFARGDPTGAQAATFDDSAWQTVDVPHDWSIAGPFAADAPTRGAGAFLPSGVAWYRRAFDAPSCGWNGRVYLELDGVMHRSDVYVNGTRVGGRPNGYVSQRYDVTEQLRSGSNFVAVRADTSQQPASRWYSGAGLYRHARLVATSDAVHLVPDGVYVAPRFVLSEQATISIHAEAMNERTRPVDVRLRVEIVAPDGASVASGEGAPKTIGAGQLATFDQDAWVARPQLWDIGKGVLYTARVSLKTSATGETLDATRESFGIREAMFLPDRGFVLNARDRKLKGVCLHVDGGMVGAAVPLAVWEHRLRALQAIGVNAIRTAHNPPAPEFLDLCDRLGLVVMDELFDAWTVGKNPFDDHLEFNDWSKSDVRDTVRRDRNHPSVILWSAGNEIHDTPQGEKAKAILKGLVETFHESDPYRPVTQALFRPNVSHDYDNGLAELLDVVGQNYRENELIAAANQKPTRSIVGTETTQARPAWLAMRDDKRFSGQFLWAGIDYLGEARQWPTNTSSSGVLDRTGAMKPQSYERQSWWSDVPMVHVTRRVAPTALAATDPGYEAAGAPQRRTQVLFDDWTPRTLEAHEELVEAYTNADEVELFLNDQSLGTKPQAADASALQWRVPFAPGTLRAIARTKGAEVARDELRTAGAPAALKLTLDRDHVGSTFDDVAFATVEVVDANGIRVPTATPKVTFGVGGPGTIVAVDNADVRSVESFQAKERVAHQGRCVALVRGAGGRTVTITAKSDGLRDASATLRSDAPAR